jgi:two-component system, NtrC family, sensor kinase
MEAVAVLVAFGLVAGLVVRERMWRARMAAASQELRASQVDSHERDQLASVGQLVSGLAQELKAPIQGVIGNAELVLASGTLGAESAGEVRAIQENAERAAGIVRNLLAFTETTTLSLRWQDVNDLVSHAIDGVRGELDASGVHVQFARTDRLPLMYVDGRQLEKVIATLLSRPSPRSAPRGETATVTLATRRLDLKDRLIIEVDDRTAADPSDEPTWSGDLAACRQIVQAHGGTLEVEHPANGGFRFHLELPVTAVGAEATAAAG